MSEEVKKEAVKTEADQVKDMLSEDKKIVPKEEPKVEKKEEPKVEKEEKPKEKVEEKVEEKVDEAVDLMAVLNELAGGVTAKVKEEKKEEEPKVEEKPKPEEKKKEEVKEVLSDKDFEDLFESKKAFLDFLAKRDEEVRKETRKNSLQDTQDIISKSVYEQVVRYTAAQTFWKDNADLKPLGSLVAKKANEIAGKNPDMDIHKVFAETGKEVRSILDAVKKTMGKEDTDKEKKLPGFVKPPGPTGAEEKVLTGTKGEIATLIKMLNNT